MVAREVKLNELDGVLAEFDYPVSREEVAASCDGVTLLLADGVENLGRTVRQSSDDWFESVDELRNEIMSRLPRRAVGEPNQSEGDA